MMNVTCLKHPKYDGSNPPDLSCKTCCSRFVNRIRAEQAMKFEELVKPKAPNTHQAKSAYANQSRPSEKTGAKAGNHFDPSWI